MMLLLIAAVPNVVYAGESDKNGTEGTNTEPECDYIEQPDYT